MQSSRRLAVLVNIAKIALLAALAPPVVIGIAQRAMQLGGGSDVSAIVAFTVSTGSIGAVLGALSLGFFADWRRPSVRSRWAWVACGASLGTAGLLVMASSSSAVSLVGGWFAAQFGYSGAMAVLRALLASALTQHRRRGAVVIVLGAYGGLLIPLGVLLVYPNAIWETTLGLAAASLAIPLLVLSGARPRVAESAGSPGAPSRGRARTAPARTRSIAMPTRARRSVPRPALLLIQCASNVVVAAFLSYHPLDIAMRIDASGFPVSASIQILLGAVAGLVVTSGVLLRFPRVLAYSAPLIATAGAVLALSLVLRASSDSLLMIACAAFLSGAAVGLNNSALLGAALEAAPPQHHGRFLGAFSAAGALGQFIGPLIALGVLAVTAAGPFVSFDDPGGFRTMFLCIAVVPVAWTIGILALLPRTSAGAPQGTEAR